MKKLIVVPLAIMAIIILMLQMGLISAAETLERDLVAEGYAPFEANADGWWLLEGRQVLDNWGNRVSEFGQQWGTGDRFYWLNTTNAYDPSAYGNVDPTSRDISYPMIFLANGESSDFSQFSVGVANMDVDVTGGLYGVLAIVVGLIVFAGVVGLKIFGSGIDTGITVVKGTGYLTLWALCSVMGYSVFTDIPYSLGLAFYFILTMMYSIGVIGEFS